MMRHRTLIFACVLAATLPLRTLATQEQHDEHDPGVAHEQGIDEHATGGHEAEGRGPLLSFDPGMAVWSIIVFGILLIVLGKFAWKPILAGLQQREKFITDSLESAKHEREQAEKLLKQYTEQIEHARVEATAIVEEGKRDAEAVRRRIHEDAKKEADEMVARAKREIAIARDDAVKALYERTLDLATDVAGKIIRRKVSGDDHRDLLNESLAEMARVET